MVYINHNFPKIFPYSKSTVHSWHFEGIKVTNGLKFIEKNETESLKANDKDFQTVYAKILNFGTKVASKTKAHFWNGGVLELLCSVLIFCIHINPIKNLLNLLKTKWTIKMRHFINFVGIFFHTKSTTTADVKLIVQSTVL